MTYGYYIKHHACGDEPAGDKGAATLPRQLVHGDRLAALRICDIDEAALFHELDTGHHVASRACPRVVDDGALVRVAALIATAVDGIIVIDARGTIAIYNSACERLFGYRPEDCPVAHDIGQRTLSLPLGPALTDDEQTRVIAAVRHLLA